MTGLITCPPATGILREGTTPLRLLRTVEALAGDGEVALTLAKGARCTFWALTGTEQAWVTLRTDPVVVVVPLDALGVDLTDSTGRAHVAWWLGTRAPGVAIDLWTRTITDERWRRRFLAGLCVTFRLAHLDPTDGTRLEDGSRVVDAQALAAVALHYLAAAESAP